VVYFWTVTYICRVYTAYLAGEPQHVSYIHSKSHIYTILICAVYTRFWPTLKIDVEECWTESVNQARWSNKLCLSWHKAAAYRSFFGVLSADFVDTQRNYAQQRYCSMSTQRNYAAVCQHTAQLRTTAVPQYMRRVGQNRIYTPYMTVYFVISLPKIPYIHRIYMVLANLIYAVPQRYTAAGMQYHSSATKRSCS